MAFRRTDILMGTIRISEYEWDEASPERIAEMKRILCKRD